MQNSLWKNWLGLLKKKINVKNFRLKETEKCKNQIKHVKFDQFLIWKKKVEVDCWENLNMDWVLD